MSRLPTTNAADDEEASSSKEDIPLEQKIGMAKKFDREMKDYAKATVKEFLGIYGYEEDVDINIDDSETQKGEASTSQNISVADKPTESELRTCTDCDNLGDKTQLEMVGPKQAESVVTINLEACDVNEASEVSITNPQKTSVPDCSVINKEVPVVSSLSDKVSELQCLTVTETLTSEVVKASDVEISNLEVETSEFQTMSLLHSGMGAQKEPQGQVELPRDALASQNHSKALLALTSELPALQQQSHSKKLSELQDEFRRFGSEGNTASQGIEILGIWRKGQLCNVASKTQRTRENEDGELDGESQRKSERTEIGDEMVGPCVTMFEKVHSLSELENQNEEFVHDLRSQNEAPGSQDQLEVQCEVTDELSELETQSEGPKSEDVTELSHGPQQAPHSLSQVLQSNDEASSLCEKLISEQTDKSSVRFDQTTDIPFVSSPTPSEILDAISRIALHSQSTDKLTVLQEHNYAGNAEDSPAQASQDPYLDSGLISNCQFIEKQYSSVLPAYNPNIECSDEVQSTRDSGIESGVNSNPQLSPMKLCASSQDSELNSRNESDLIQEPRVDPSIRSSETETAHVSTSQPVLDLVIVCSSMHLPAFSTTSNSSLKVVQPKALNSSSSTNLNRKEKSRVQRRKYRDNESPEKRETRLRLQRERARTRRSNESEAEKEARREKDRKRQQLKRARDNNKRKDSVDALDTASHTHQAGESDIFRKDRARLSPESNTSYSTELVAGSVTDATSAVATKKAKTRRDSGSTNILVASQRGEPTDRRQSSYSESNHGESTTSTENPLGHSSVAIPSVDLISAGSSTTEHENSTCMFMDVSSSNVSSTTQVLEDLSEDEEKTCTKESDDRQQDQLLSDVQEIPASLTPASESSNLRKDQDLNASASLTSQVPQGNLDVIALPEDKAGEHGSDSLKPSEVSSEVREDITLETQAVSSGCVGSRRNKNVTTNVQSPQESRGRTDGRSNHNSNDSAASINREESNEKGREELEENQMLYKAREATSSSSTSVFSVSHKDEGRANRSDSALVRAIRVKPKHSPLEKDPAASVVSQKEKNRVRMNKRRSLETPEQREARLKGQRERVKKRRAHESETERQVRKLRDRIRQYVKRSSESEEDRRKRLLQQRDAARRRRALETPEVKEERRSKDRDRARRSRESKRAGVVKEWW